MKVNLFSAYVLLCIKMSIRKGIQDDREAELRFAEKAVKDFNIYNRKHIQGFSRKIKKKKSKKLNRSKKLKKVDFVLKTMFPLIWFF